MLMFIASVMLFMFAKKFVTSSGLFKFACLAMCLNLLPVGSIVALANWFCFIPHNVLKISSLWGQVWLVVGRAGFEPATSAA